jgi:Protein of unknown function (DUF1573)
MKKLIALCSIAFVFACSSKGDAVEVGKKTTLEVNDIFDAGTVVKGEVIRAVFTVTNTGDCPLVFGEVRPSCSCTVADKPSEPIQPGESTEIIAKVNTANVSSKEVTKSVTIMTNTTPSTKVLIIKAKIK